MAFYEVVFIVRPDVASVDVDKIISGVAELVVQQAGKVIKKEYWGIRQLAYEINNNKKGHYVLLGLETGPDTIIEMERKMKLSEDIIRCATLRVEVISPEPSPILKGKSSENEEIIDVTLNKDLI